MTQATPGRAGWYPDPLRPETQERRWDGSEWTEETREASVRPDHAAPTPPAAASPVGADREPWRSAPPPEIGPTVVVPVGRPEPLGVTTYVLLLAIVVLVGVLLCGLLYVGAQRFGGPFEDDAKISSERPVLISQAAERSAVDTAARAAVAFSARSYDSYDEQVDQAAAMMTEAFAKEFRQTTDDAREQFVAAQAEVTADVVAQGVMTASPQQVEVLIFLNQFTTKKDEDPVMTPFRLKVTLIDDEDQGWLVSDVDAA
jgi:Mce-associated membrane protein